jgi:exodeoxyribonuclease VII large subunit
MGTTKIEGLVIKDRVYTVSEVTEIVKTALEVAFPQVWVEGEVSGYKRAASGHLFFSLKDEKSVIKAVLWQSAARKVAFDLKDGLKVVCRGKVSVYEPRGDYQLYVDQVEPKGKGALQLAFEQLKEKLRAEGLFDEARSGSSRSGRGRSAS